MKYSHLILSACLLIIVSCGGPKTTEKIVSTDTVRELPEASNEVINPDCLTLGQLEYALRDETETAYVLYRDFLKAKDFKEALPLWKKAFYLAPAANGKVKYQFDDGVKLYKNLYENTTDVALKKSYLDTVMSIYDKRVVCYPEDQSYVLGRKGFDYYYSFYSETTPANILDIFKTTMDMSGEKADYFIINPFTKLLYDGYIDESIDVATTQKYANKLWSAINYGTANCKGKECEAWEIINAYAPARLESFEGVDDFYGCDYYSNKYLNMYEEDSTSCENINLIYRRLLRGNCDMNQPQFAAIKNAKDNTCYTPPPAPGDLRQGYDAYNAGQYTQAIKHFEDYVAGQSDAEKKAKYLMVIAKIYYGDIKNFPKSRKYALDAAALKANWGDPYILIGKLYASSGPLCGPGTGWDSQIVTWPAIDKFAYAKKIDPTVAAEANKWISTYKQYMPTKEDVFFRSGITVGGPFKVGCWIQENTTVRTAD